MTSVASTNVQGPMGKLNQPANATQTKGEVHSAQAAASSECKSESGVALASPATGALKRTSSDTTLATSRTKRQRKNGDGGAANRPPNMNARPSPLLRTATSESLQGMESMASSPRPSSPTPSSPTASDNGKHSKGNRFVLPAFLSKLYEIVDDTSWSHVIKWSQSGTTFVVVNETELSKQVLPRYFKHNNFSSFVRQLNMYGFRKLKAVLTNDWEYHHPKFQRGRAGLLHEIKRRWSGTNSNNGTLPQKAQGAIQSLQDEKASLQRRLDHYKSMVEVLMKEKTEALGLVDDLTMNNTRLSHEVWALKQALPPHEVNRILSPAIGAVGEAVTASGPAHATTAATTTTAAPAAANGVGAHSSPHPGKPGTGNLSVTIPSHGAGQNGTHSHIHGIPAPMSAPSQVGGVSGAGNINGAGGGSGTDQSGQAANTAAGPGSQLGAYPSNGQFQTASQHAMANQGSPSNHAVLSPALSSGVMMSPRSNLLSPTPGMGSPRPSQSNQEGMSLLSLVASTSNNEQGQKQQQQQQTTGKANGGKKGATGGRRGRKGAARGKSGLAEGSTLFPPAVPSST